MYTWQPLIINVQNHLFSVDKDGNSIWLNCETLASLYVCFYGRRSWFEFVENLLYRVQFTNLLFSFSRSHIGVVHFFPTRPRELSLLKITFFFLPAVRCFIILFDFLQIEALSSADGSSPPASRDNSSAATSLEF